MKALALEVFSKDEMGFINGGGDVTGTKTIINADGSTTIIRTTIKDDGTVPISYQGDNSMTVERKQLACVRNFARG